MGSKYKYGLLGAGAVRRSLIGRLPSRARDIGPVCSTSYRVASRIANSVRAGYAVRNADELSAVPVVLVNAPPQYLEGLVSQLRNSGIDWSTKALVFCDCAPGEEALGAGTAVVQEFGGRLIAQGAEGAAMRPVQALARDLGIKAARISNGARDVFGAAVLLGTAAITPLIDRAAEMLHEAGIREGEAARMAASWFEQTARDYAHSGQQSWAWYVRAPAPGVVDAQVGREAMLRELVLFGLERFGKHEEVRKILAGPPAEPRP